MHYTKIFLSPDNSGPVFLHGMEQPGTRNVIVAFRSDGTYFTLHLYGRVSEPHEIFRKRLEAADVNLTALLNLEPCRDHKIFIPEDLSDIISLRGYDRPATISVNVVEWSDITADPVFTGMVNR